MEILIKGAQLLLSLSLLVVIHELGHYSFARLFNTRVEKFYLFFNPWFSLFKKKIGETTYGIGWLPLGGYVKISGMIDESMDRSQMQKEPQPWEFRSKTAVQRFWIMFGGVLFNFILAFLIYSMILFTWGERYLPVENATYGVYCDSTALSLGLEHGDHIIKVGDTEPEVFSDILLGIVVDGAESLTIKRNGSIKTIDIPESFSQELIASENVSFVTAFIPFVIDSLLEGKPAQLAGLRVDDNVIGIDSVSTPAYYDFVKAIKQYKGKEVYLHYIRKGFEDSTLVAVSPEGLIGVGVKGVDKLFTIEKKEYSFIEAIPAGVNLAFETLGGYAKQMKLIFTAEGAKQVGGFGSIGSMFPPTWEWHSFWTLTALLSVILAFMNILPIPALDGGHIMFLVYEIVTGRKPSEKVLEVAQLIGMALLFTLLIFANGNDLFKAFAE